MMDGIQVGAIIRRESLEGWNWGTFRVVAVKPSVDRSADGAVDLTVAWAGDPKSLSTDRYERYITQVGPDGISTALSRVPIRIVLLRAPEPVEGATLDLFAP
jgi:hypothetical protein